MARGYLLAVMGLPGSGKSTFARLVAAKIDAEVFSGGDELRRRQSQADTDATELINTYRPIPEAAYREVLLGWMSAARSEVLVLDGSPRDGPQVGVLTAVARRPVLGVLLDVSIPTAVQRLRGRATTSARSDDQGDVARRVTAQQQPINDAVRMFSERCLLLRLAEEACAATLVASCLDWLRDVRPLPE